VQAGSSFVSLSSLNGSVKDGSNCVDDIAIETDSFDTLVHNLLRASLSDESRLGKHGAAPPPSNGCALENAEDAGGTNAFSNYPVLHPVVNGPHPESCSMCASANGGDEAKKSSEGMRSSLDELLRRQRCDLGLLRPQDLELAGSKGSSSESGGVGEVTISQLKHARLCAAAALERAHLRCLLDSGLEGEGGAGTQDGVQCLLAQSKQQLLHPLALTLAATLRHSDESLLVGGSAWEGRGTRGIAGRGEGGCGMAGEEVGDRTAISADDQQPWYVCCVLCVCACVCVCVCVRARARVFVCGVCERERCLCLCP
jgi:hypothetical protein